MSRPKTRKTRIKACECLAVIPYDAAVCGGCGRRCEPTLTVPTLTDERMRTLIDERAREATPHQLALILDACIQATRKR